LQAAKTAGGPTRVEKAKIGLIQFHLSPPKADIENTVVISDYAQVRKQSSSATCTVDNTVVISDCAQVRKQSSSAHMHR
jgi:hypothetical protein